MNDTEYPERKKFSTHLLEDQTRSRTLPKDLLELQDYLRQLSVYVEKYKRIKNNLDRQNSGVPSVAGTERKWFGKKSGPYREIGFSVKEEIGESSPVQIIELTPPEEVTVIYGNEKRRKSEYEDEKEISSVIPNSEVKTGPDMASDNSEIGIYLIEFVKPVNFVNVLQRELSTLGKIFPNVNDIIKQITHEFDHYKVCRKCLDKVSPLLPDILKELQELIKFVRKKRNEEYVWPDDSDYLRKTSEVLPKPYEKQCKQLQRQKIREETVGFLTVHTNTPQIIREFEARVKSEPQSEDMCSARASSRRGLTALLSKIQDDLAHVEKTGTAEVEVPGPTKRNIFDENLSLTEFSTSQVLRILHPARVVLIVLQYKVRGNIGYTIKQVDSVEDQSDKFLEVTNAKVESERFGKPQALGLREFLLTANNELRRACVEIQMESEGNSKMANELKTVVKDLKNLILEVHKNQIELSKFLLERDVLNPSIIKLTDPRVISEEKETVRKAKIILSDANLDNRRMEDLQCLVDRLKSKCDMKNRLITSLLKGLRNDVPCEEWEELIAGVIQHSDSVSRLQTEKVVRCQPRSVCSQRQFSAEEILSEREIAQATYEQGETAARDTARTSRSEVLPKTSECLLKVNRMIINESLLKAKSVTMKDLNIETEKLFKDLENEVNSLTFEHNKILREIEELKRQKSVTDKAEGNKTAATETRTINLTIKIGDQDSISGYHSALSIVPSGASLKEKKPELSFPVNMGEVAKAPGMKYSAQEFKSALNFLKEELSKSYSNARKSFTSLAFKLKLPVSFEDEETHCASKGIIKRVTEEKLENCTAASLYSGTTCATARKSKYSICGSDGASGSCLNKDFNGNRSSNEEITDSRLSNDFFINGLSHLQPEMNIHCAQSETVKKLRSRLRFLEEDLHYLKMTIDRMDILTEKLMDDTHESSENLKYIYNIFHFITSRSSV